MGKKRFKTKAEKKVWRLSTIVFFVISAVFLAIFLYVFIGFYELVDTDLPGSAKMLVLIGIIAIQIFLFLFFPAAGVFFGIQFGRKRGYREHASFNVTHGITYYRDILCDVSPADLSIVMDLKIDSRKDVSATLLRLYNKKIIDFENNRIVLTGNNASLDNGERELVSMISSGGITQHGIYAWKEFRRQEAIHKGYVEKLTKISGCATGCVTGCLSTIIAVVCLVAFIFMVDVTMFDDYEVVIERLENENAVMLESDVEIINSVLIIVVVGIGLFNIIITNIPFATLRHKST